MTTTRSRPRPSPPAGAGAPRLSTPRRRTARARLRRAATLLPSTLLIGALGLTGTAHADPAAANKGLADPAAAASTWAASQLTDGTHASSDHGLTADIVMGLAATGTDGAAADRATTWLEENAGAYVHRRGEGSLNAGGTAKLALVASIQDRDPGNFGGLDLTGLLLESVDEDGRFRDAPVNSDLSNQFAQSLGVLALARTGDVPEDAVRFLTETQCPDGGFPLSLRRDPARCTSDPDSTGMAVQALLAAGRTGEVGPALNWLEGAQLEDGGFFQHPVYTPNSNSNSTALAVQALTAGGRDAAAAAGVDFLHSVQVGCDAAPADRGAVGYEEPVADGMALRATAQVIPALAGVALGDVDGRGAQPEPYAIACDPGGGDGGGGSTGGDGGDSGDGGGDGGGDGDDGGTTDGGTTDGDSTGGDTTGGGTDDGTTGGTTSGNTDGGADGATGGTAAGGLGWDGADVFGDMAGNQPSPDGDLASTGTSALPLLWLATGLLATGGIAYAVTVRHRRDATTTAA